MGSCRDCGLISPRRHGEIVLSNIQKAREVYASVGVVLSSPTPVGASSVFYVDINMLTKSLDRICVQRDPLQSDSLECENRVKLQNTMSLPCQTLHIYVRKGWLRNHIPFNRTQLACNNMTMPIIITDPVSLPSAPVWLSEIPDLINSISYSGRDYFFFETRRLQLLNKARTPESPSSRIAFLRGSYFEKPIIFQMLQ